MGLLDSIKNIMSIPEEDEFEDEFEEEEAEREQEPKKKLKTRIGNKGKDRVSESNDDSLSSKLKNKPNLDMLS